MHSSPSIWPTDSANQLQPSAGKSRLSLLGKYAVFFFAFCVVLYLRRWDQFRHPQVWDEDGTVLLRDYIKDGWMSLFHPACGYIIFISRLISVIAIRISYIYYPNIGTLLSWIFTAFVCLAITFCPTWMRGRALLGFCALLVPSDAEVIGVPLYPFWWASLLLFVVVLWENDSRDVILRSVFLLVAGLSTPIVVLIPPLLGLRFILLEHKRRNGYLFLVSLLCASLQFWVSQLAGGARTNTPGMSDVVEIIPRFFGNYVVGNLWNDRTVLWIAGTTTIVFILVGAKWERRKLTFPFLMFLCISSILMCAMRNPLNILLPAVAGPRYFFFPFVLISWMLVNIGAMRGHIVFRGGAAIILLFALVNVYPVLHREHYNLHWRDRAVSAVHFDSYSMPVQFDGHSEPWYFTINKNQAQALLANDLFASRNIVGQSQPFPYTVVKLVPAGAAPPPTCVGISSLVGAAMPAANFPVNSVAGFTVVGSFLHGDADRLSISLHLHRGDKVAYCSGADAHRQFVKIQETPIDFSIDLPISPQWTVLDFSSDQLPGEFIAVFSDRGGNPGEWFALALKN